MKKTTKTLVALFAVASLGLNACKKEELPPIGGFNSADEVAATNLSPIGISKEMEQKRKIL